MYINIRMENKLDRLFRFFINEKKIKKNSIVII